ncbi:hypothetical protein G6F23_014087 [Rhizopus arrhizus]|nr:hypothetical protein G6F23_014087 [Rhizopus arrhizus]
MVQCSRPCALTASDTAASWSGATISTKPMPQLKVRHISLSATAPSFCSHWNTGGRVQDDAWMSRPRPSGTTRMMFSVRPPPVMWAMPWMASPCDFSSDRIGFTYRRVGAISASTSFTPPSSSRSAGWPARS